MRVAELEGPAMLSAATMKFYRGLWAQLRAANGLSEADRKPLHAHLGLPASSKDFSPEDFDRWKGYVLAAVKPENVTAQLAQQAMPQTRRLVFIGHLLNALEEGEEHAEALVVSLRDTESYMRRPDGRMGGRFATLHTLSLRGLDAVRNRLKDECRARWRTKESLLDEAQTVRMCLAVDAVRAQAAVMHALNVDTVPVLDALDYDRLLVVLSALRTLTPGRRWVGFSEPSVPAAENIPF